VSDDIRDDETPDINDPDLDAFTQVMEDVVQTEVVPVEPNRQHVDDMALAIATVIDDYVRKTPDVLYYEALVALGSTFCGVSRRMMHAVDFDMFPITRQSVNEILGAMVARVNEYRPTMEQLEEAEVDSPIIH